MKSTLIPALLFALSTALHAQTFEWAGQLGGGSANTVHRSGLAADAEGNVYMTGHFTGTTDMDPGPGITSFSATNTDAFVVKLDANGNLLWAAQLTGNFEAYGVDVAVAPDGSVIVVGQFIGTVDLDPGAGVQNVTATGVADLFILKLNSAGQFQWARTFHEDSDFPFIYAHAVSVSPAGTIAVAGEFAGTMPLPTSAGDITSLNNENDYFLLSLDAFGNVLWGRAIGSAQSEGGLGGNGRSDVACGNDGSIHMIGLLKGSIVFDADAPNGTLAPPGGNIDIFLARYNADGSLNWVQGFGGADDDGYNEQARMGSVAVRPNGDVYFASNVSGVVELAPGVIAGSGFSRKDFVARAQADGTVLWARSMEADVQAIAVDAAGAVYCTGYAGNGSNMDIGFTNTTVSYSSFFAMPYLSRFTSDGALTFVGGFDAATPSDQQTGYGVAAGGGKVYASGYFKAATDFDPSAGQAVLSPLSNVGEDAYLVRFAWAVPGCTPAGVGSITADGGNTVCEGEPLTLNVSGNLNGNTVWAWTAGSDCSGDGLGGGNSITFVPAASGSYSVRGAGGCLPGPCQSIAITVEVCTGIGEATASANALQYVNDLALLRINTSAPATLMLVDALGRNLSIRRMGPHLQELDMQQLVPGTYVAVLVYDGGEREVRRFVR